MSEELNFESYGPSKDKASGRGKRGALSNPEKEFIKKNASILTVQEISERLGKSVAPIRKYIYQTNLVSKDELAKNSAALEEAKCKDILRHREYWPEIKQQFTVGEIKVFEQIWTKLWLQFNGDVLASEELQMKKYITLEIMRDRFGKQIFTCIKEIEDIENRMTVAKNQANPDRDEIRALSLQLERHQTNHIALSKQQRETMQEQKSVEGQLRVSRDDRVKSVQDATKNWTTIIRLLNDNAAVRTEVGKHIELMRIAKDKSQLLLGTLHTYVDGSIDRPIISESTMGDIDGSNTD